MVADERFRMMGFWLLIFASTNLFLPHYLFNEDPGFWEVRSPHCLVEDLLIAGTKVTVFKCRSPHSPKQSYWYETTDTINK